MRSLLAAVPVTLMLASCAGPAVLNVSHTPPQDSTNVLASISPASIKVLNFRDERGGVEPVFLGRRFAAMQVPMGDVLSERPVSEIVTEAVGAELASAGHRLVQLNEGVVVSGAILRFSADTPVVTALYWDVVAEVRLVVELESAATGATLATRTYGGQASERTYVNPSDKLMEATLERALGEAMAQMRSDPTVAQALSNPN